MKDTTVHTSADVIAAGDIQVQIIKFDFKILNCIVIFLALTLLDKYLSISWMNIYDQKVSILVSMTLDC